MDPDIASWMLEYLARQPISQPLLNKILTNTQIPIVSTNNNPRFKKTLLLRSIQDEISNGSASSETILESLESIEELDRMQQIHLTDSMKLAYQAVALDCTVKWVVGESDKYQFFEAVKRIWRERFERLELLKKSDLVTDELREIKEEMEAALFDSNACKRLLDREVKNQSLRLVKDYLKEAMGNVEPSFLELAAKVEREMKEKEKGVKSCVADGDGPVRRDKENQKNDVPDPQCQELDQIVHSERVHMNITLCNRNLLSTPAVAKVREALKSSCLELKAIVKDPLPNALYVSENLIAGMKRTVLNEDTSVRTKKGKGSDVPNPSISPAISRAASKILNRLPSTEAVNQPVIHPMETNSGISESSHQNVNPKQSLMVRNSTARTFEWNDSIDGSADETAADMNRVQMGSLERRAVSLLKNKVAVRRKIKRWSVEEEDALREGVQMFGIGNWKVILNSKRGIFAERTEVDLKDKWRNMMK